MLGTKVSSFAKSLWVKIQQCVEYVIRKVNEIIVFEEYGETLAVL